MATDLFGTRWYRHSCSPAVVLLARHHQLEGLCSPPTSQATFRGMTVDLLDKLAPDPPLLYRVRTRLAPLRQRPVYLMPCSRCPLRIWRGGMGTSRSRDLVLYCAADAASARE